MLDGLSRTWTWSPLVLLLLLAFCLLYIVRVRQVQVRHPLEKPIKAYHVVAFFSGIVLVALLLLSPINTIARTQLFLVHMAQVVTLITFCSPLILFGCPEVLLRPFIGARALRGISWLLTRPLVDSVIFNTTFLLWHAPVIYDKIQRNSSLYTIAMLSIFLVSLLNWWPLIGSVKELRAMSYPMQMMFAFFDGQPVDIFAFILVFSGTVLYPHYATPSQFVQVGVNIFADQTAGGALLLVPGIVDLIVMTPLFFRWLGQIEVQTKIADQRRQEMYEYEDEDDEEYEDEGVGEIGKVSEA